MTRGTGSQASRPSAPAHPPAWGTARRTRPLLRGRVPPARSERHLEVRPWENLCALPAFGGRVPPLDLWQSLGTLRGPTRRRAHKPATHLSPLWCSPAHSYPLPHLPADFNGFQGRKDHTDLMGGQVGL